MLQLTDVLVPLLSLPDWAGRLVLLLLLVGFPVALFFAWAYALTPEGLKREADLDTSVSTGPRSTKKLNFAVLAVLCIALAYFLAQRFLPSPGSTERAPAVAEQSVAVLPFVDMSPNKDQEYFSDGIAEELLNQLTKLRGLRVAGRTSSFSFKNSNEDLRVIGKKLNVAHIIEGSVRKAGDRVRITVQLVKAVDGFHLWSETYDRELRDIFAIEEDTAKAVADTLSVTLGVGDVDFGEGGTRNFEAYDARLQAQALMVKQGTENFVRAIRLLEKSVKLDSDYADAWTTLSTAYGVSATVWQTEQADALLAKRARAAERALEITPDGVQALRASAFVAGRQQHWLEAERLYEKAQQSAPADLFNQLTFTNFLLTVGRPGEAVSYAREAVKKDPLALVASQNLAEALESHGESEAAWSELERARDLVGNQALLKGLILVFAMEQNDRPLIEKYLDGLAQDPASPPISRAFAQTIRGLLDSPEAARRDLRRRYEDPAYGSPLSHYILATYAAYFGDPEFSLQIFRELNDNGVLPGADAIWRPIFRDVRRLPGFKDFVRQRGLVDYWRETGNWGEFCHPTGPDDFECD